MHSYRITNIHWKLLLLQIINIYFLILNIPREHMTFIYNLLHYLIFLSAIYLEKSAEWESELMSEDLGTSTLWRSLPLVEHSGLSADMTPQQLKLQQVGDRNNRSF